MSGNYKGKRHKKKIDITRKDKVYVGFAVVIIIIIILILLSIFINILDLLYIE